MKRVRLPMRPLICLLVAALSGCVSAPPESINWSEVTAASARNRSPVHQLSLSAEKSEERYCAGINGSRFSNERALIDYPRHHADRSDRVRCDDNLLFAIKKAWYAVIADGSPFYERAASEPEYMLEGWLKNSYDGAYPQLSIVNSWVLLTDSQTEQAFHLLRHDARLLALAQQERNKISAELQKQEESREIAEMQEKLKDEEIRVGERKASCTSYGFEPNTDAHAKCVMELAIAAEALLQQNRQQAARDYAFQQQLAAEEAASTAAAAEAKRQREAQALINLGAAISSGGTQPSSSSPITPTIPSGASKSGRFKTCSYRVGADILTTTVVRSAICTTTHTFGSQTGFLVR